MSMYKENRYDKIAIEVTLIFIILDAISQPFFFSCNFALLLK